MRMKKSFVFILVAGFVALLSAAIPPVFAASSSCGGSGCTTGAVDLNFQINIPAMVRLRIGAAASADTITFDPSAAVLGTGASVTGTGGNLTAGEVTVQVIANGAASVDVDTSVTGGGSGLACQAGGSCVPGTDFIGWDEITTTGNGCTVAPPVLDNTGSGSANYSAGGGVIQELCSWTYTYDNSLTYLDGSYTGTVTYTATHNP